LHRGTHPLQKEPNILPKTESLKAECLRKGLTYVGFSGDPKAPVWIIGEAPGVEENKAGIPFVGTSGRELHRMLGEAGFGPNDYCCLNPYTVRPPENDIERIEETGITKDLGSFFELLSEYRPVFMCPVGGVPLAILCPDTIDRKDKESKISKWRGSLLRSSRTELSHPHYVLPNFHPAYILREWSDRDVAVFVFRRLREEYDYYSHRGGVLQPLPSRELITNAALSNDPLRAISVELFGFRAPFAAKLWRLLDTILATKHIVGQNWSTFDANWASALGLNSGIDRLDDTLVMHHVLYPEMSHKLEFLGMQFTREPYWKDEGKGWRAREGIGKLKRYNCLDAACTLEAYEAMQQEFAEEPNKKAFYENYEIPLARKFFYVDQRGLEVDKDDLAKLRIEVINELSEKCVAISQSLGGRPVVYSEAMGKALAKQLGCDSKQILNIASVPQLKAVLTNELNIKLKKDRKTGKESTGEESLNEAFAVTLNQTLKHILRTRELNKLLGTNIDTRLPNHVFYSCSAVTGTVTGRRASRKNFLGYGTNGQNIPKHSDLGEKFRGVFKARPGKIFVACDQMSAEDWLVQGIIADVSGDMTGINELRASVLPGGISRHQILASKIFGLPLDQCDKSTMNYYLGKKTRHACHYDMRENKMAAEFAKEGFAIPPKMCAQFQGAFHNAEPNIRGVFHKWVQEQVKKYRCLTTPLGRSRVFHGLRPYGDNGEVFREAYAQIPQSTVGDNTGLAVLYCEDTEPGFVLKEDHDAILGEADDSIESVLKAVDLLKRAFKRTLRFQNGFELEIPIEFEIGYTLKGLKKCPSNETGLRITYATLAQQQKAQHDTMNGAPSQPLAQSSSAMSG
jgi:uracil-DNA glycosylase family 4